MQRRETIAYLKAWGPDPEILDEILTHVSERYRVVKESNIMQSDRGGYHAFITIVKEVRNG